MYAPHTDPTPAAIKAPYFEAVARSFVSEFGEDALRMIDMAIEGMEVTGPAFALEIWRGIRLTLVRKSVPLPSAMLQ